MQAYSHPHPNKNNCNDIDEKPAGCGGVWVCQEDNRQLDKARPHVSNVATFCRSYSAFQKVLAIEPSAN